MKEDVDSDDEPLIPPRRTSNRRRSAARSKKPSRPRKRRKKREVPAPPQPAHDPEASTGRITADDLKAGNFVVTIDEHPEGLGFNVSKLCGSNQGTRLEPAFRYKHHLASVHPWQSSIVDAKFGYGRGAIQDGGSALIHGYSMVAIFSKLEKGELPQAVKTIVREHPEWEGLSE
jgi:hypothetical protein